ncbi:hypothetical protein JX266_007741 [Neoarthrinium moseri]|nr:hypothetical protein JX266_007741 [Neoarthrinium moseri]
MMFQGVSRPSLVVLALQPLAQLVLAAPEPSASVWRHDTPYLSPWVTVNSEGVAQTVTPSVQASDGSTVTVFEPPAPLTETSAWTLTINDQIKTSTGHNPVATGTGNGEEGSFMVCDNFRGRYAPICQPRAGSTLASGQVYFITWDIIHFTGGNVSVQVGGDYGNGTGFVSELMPASRGFYTWTIASDFLQEKTNPATVSLYILTVDQNDTAVAYQEEGPTVTIARMNSVESGFGGINVLAVVLPSALGVAIAAFDKDIEPLK